MYKFIHFKTISKKEFYIFSLCDKKKNPPFQWALRICSVAVSLAPPLGLEPRTL